MDKILIVDDSSFSRKQIITSLQTSFPDQSFVEAKDGVDAYEKRQDEPFKKIVLDINMPRMDGIQFLEKLGKDFVKSIRVIVHTADVQNSTRDKCIELGAWKVLNKPNLLDPEDAKAIWEEFLE